jgi:hypothetical protein
VIDRMIRARIEVEHLTPVLCCVRERRGNRIELETFAVWTGGAWCWDREGTRVPADVEAVIRGARS